MQGNSGNGAFAAAPRAAADVEQVERVQVGVRTGEADAHACRRPGWMER